MQKRPTHFTLQTHPMLRPDKSSQMNHSGEKLSFLKRWNLAQHKVVVKVKNSSMESNKMNREIVA